jgi:hypothetical protein
VRYKSPRRATAPLLPMAASTDPALPSGTALGAVASSSSRSWSVTPPDPGPGASICGPWRCPDPKYTQKVGFCQRIAVNRPQHRFPAQFRAGISTFLFHNGGWMVGWAQYGRAEVRSNIRMHESPSLWCCAVIRYRSHSHRLYNYLECTT